MKKLLLAVTVAACCAGLPSVASAQAAAPAAATSAAASPQVDAAVKELLDAMDMRKMMAASFTEMEKALPAMMRAQITAVVNADSSMNPAQRKAALAKVEQMLPGAAQAINKLFRDPALLDEMMREIAPLYSRNYTAAELKELTAFYRTPVGRKMLALSPRLAAESMQIGQRIVTPRLNDLMQDVMQGAQGKK